jgi:hypothetical protein
MDAHRARSCNEYMTQLGNQRGSMYCKMLPPYLKWPIWRARVTRDKRAPSTLKMLEEYLQSFSGCHSSKELVQKRRFELNSTPRIGLEVSYEYGEVSSLDRRVFLALTDNAIRSASTEGYELPVPALQDSIGLARKKRDALCASLWCLTGTTMRVTAVDQLAGEWGTKLFALLPTVGVVRSGRSAVIAYDLPEQTKKMIEAKRITTINMHALQSLNGSAIAESLYLFLYDMSQWFVSRNHVTYTLADLAVRLGLSDCYEHAGRNSKYRDWGSLRAKIQRATERVYMVFGVLRDYRIEGSGAETNFTFYFATERRIAKLLGSAN